MALFKPLVGGRESLATTELHEGYVYFCDDGSLFFDYKDESGALQRKQINGKDAETLLGATLVNELTNSKTEIPTSKVVSDAINKINAEKANKNHDHDDIYYTESEIDGLIDGLASENYVDEKVKVFEEAKNVGGIGYLYADNSNTLVVIDIKNTNFYPTKILGFLNDALIIPNHIYEAYFTNGDMELTIQSTAQLIRDDSNGEAGATILFENKDYDFSFAVAMANKDYLTVVETNVDTEFSVVIKDVTAVKTIDPKFLPPNVQPDWEQNDPAQSDYIKNRICYDATTVNTTILLDEPSKHFTTDDCYADFRLELEKVYTVRVDDEIIVETPKTLIIEETEVEELKGIEITYIGNPSLFLPTLPSNEKTLFVCNNANGDGVSIIINSNMQADRSVFASVDEVVGEIKKIDSKFLYQANWDQNDSTQPDYIKNRICYENLSFGTVCHTFDGNIENKECVEVDPDSGICLVKVSDQTPSISEVIGGTFKVSYEGQYELVEIEESSIEDGTSAGVPMYLIGQMSICVVFEDFSMEGLSITKGIWFINDPSGTHVSELTYEGMISDIHTIDPKYLPKGGFGYEELDNGKISYTFDGNLDSALDYFNVSDGTYIVKIADTAPSMNDIIGGTVVVEYDGEEFTETVTEDMIYDGTSEGIDGYIVADMAFCLFSDSDLGGIALTKGIWVMYLPGSVVVKEASYYGLTTKVYKIDEKFLPKNSWNNLEDKPFYYERNVIYQDVLDHNNIMKISPAPTVLTAGHTYDVNFDGVQFNNVECLVAADVGTILGNPGLLGGDVNTGENFAIFYVTNGDTPYFVIIAEDQTLSTHTVEIAATKLKKIDSIFLPDAIESSVESSTVLASDELITNYSLEENATIDDAFGKIKTDLENLDITPQLNALEENINTRIDTLEESVNAKIAEDYIVLKDAINGYNYIIQMQNGNLVSFSRCASIKVTQMPSNTNYMASQIFDPDGMVVEVVREDGSCNVITNYTYGSIPNVNAENTIVDFVINYNEFGKDYTATIPLAVNPFDPTIALIDFEYTTNINGTYTITDWKKTYNGEPSTKLIVPDSSLVII